MRFPVFDLHCDTLFEMANRACNMQSNDLHIDLARASELPGYAQCFACFTSDHETLPLELTPQELFEKEIIAFNESLQHNKDLLCQALDGGAVEENLCKKRMSAILSIEGPAGFDYAPERLAQLYDLGFRITTLGWNESNPLCGSHATGGGLTQKGRDYIREAQRLGMLIDVSHISDEAFWDIINMTTLPVIASHSNSRHVWNVSRNLTDEMFKAICDVGGVVGINLYAHFLGEDPDLNTVCDHILHFLSIDKEGSHISLGGDLDGCDQLPKGFSGIQDYPKLAQCLLARGLSYDEVYKIFWNNAVGVMKRCCI